MKMMKRKLGVISPRLYNWNDASSWFKVITYHTKRNQQNHYQRQLNQRWMNIWMHKSLQSHFGFLWINTQRCQSWTLQKFSEVLNQN
ncbi:uncharacterized protein RBU33_010819 isoform 3-T3 [Hipposideros larvatus]